MICDCNGSCARGTWIQQVLKSFKSAPEWIQGLDVKTKTDYVHFGDGGVLQRRRRVRLPCLFGIAWLIWICEISVSL